MNTKIIVALIVGLALVGMTGVAFGGEISSNTEISGTYFTSESYTSVSGMPVDYSYMQSFQAEMTVPSYSQDFSNTNLNLVGTAYSVGTSIESSPTQNTVSTTIANPSDVTGIQTRENCALLGQGIEQETVILPQPIYEPATSLWEGSHPDGLAYPAYSSESYNIYWP